ncbi:unnamed protein product [Lathyrus sativus]|nr:unnamed protein product [Lathyrus sativus]
MYEEVEPFGDIDEVVILNKRDVRGKRYDFVRFFNVENVRILAMKLENIFIGKKKLFVNIPRFQRKQGGGPIREKARDREDAYDKREFSIKTIFGEHRSYTNVVNNNFINVTHEEKAKLIFAHVEYNIRDFELEIFKKMYIGIVENVGLSYSMQDIFNAERYFSIHVTPLGENMCLLEDRDEGEMEALLAER